jgi:hypothetical protein
MKELEKLEQAAESLDFQVTSRIPPVSPLIGGRDYRACAVDDPFAKKLHLNRPDELQCQAMRAVLYFWKVLRIREAVVYVNDAGRPAVVLDFGEAREEVELPEELGHAPVSPVRMISNMVLGKLHDEAIATRGQMISEALGEDVSAGLVGAAEDRPGVDDDVTGVRRAPAGVRTAVAVGEEDVVEEIEDISDSLELIEE